MLNIAMSCISGWTAENFEGDTRNSEDDISVLVTYSFWPWGKSVRTEALSYVFTLSTRVSFPFGFSVLRPSSSADTPPAAAASFPPQISPENIEPPRPLLGSLSFRIRTSNWNVAQLWILMMATAKFIMQHCRKTVRKCFVRVALSVCKAGAGKPSNEKITGDEQKLDKYPPTSLDLSILSRFPSLQPFLVLTARKLSSREGFIHGRVIHVPP